MNAAIDAGNTLIKIGIFEDGRLLAVDAFPSYATRQIYQYLENKHFESSIISSVIAFPAHLLSYFKLKSSLCIVLDQNTPLPVTHTYKQAQTLGKDRLALAVAGFDKYPAKDVLVIGAGTCITYNFVSAKGKLMGGAISPGLHSRINAMHNDTASLPLVDIVPDAPLVANNTAEAMSSGAVNGARFEIEGFVNNIRKKYKNCQVILSGGDSRYLAEKLNITEIDIEPDLALKGLHIILKFNAPEKN